MGNACGLVYVYSPLSFARSHGHSNAFEIVDKCRTSVLLEAPSILTSRFLAPFIRKFSQWLFTLASWLGPSAAALDARLLEAIGFKFFELSLSDDRFAQYTILSIKVDSLFEDSLSVTQFDAIRLKILSMIDQSEVIIEFVWTPECYRIIPHFDSVLGCNNMQFVEKLRLVLSGKHRLGTHGARPGNETIKKLVSHIRLGDSVSINLGEKFLTVVGDRVSLIENIPVDGIDPCRMPVKVESFEAILAQSVETISRNQLEIIIISDGYSSSFRLILNAILNGSIKVSRQDLKILCESRKILQSQLDNLILAYSSKSIIGEAHDKLIPSLQEVAMAKILVWGTGGFSLYANKLFGLDPDETITIHALSNSDDTLRSLTKGDSV